MKKLDVKTLDTSNINIKFNGRQYPLFYFTLLENYESVKKCIDLGADVNLVNSFHFGLVERMVTTIEWALKVNEIRIVELLLKNGAKIPTMRQLRLLNIKPSDAALRILGRHLGLRSITKEANTIDVFKAVLDNNLKAVKDYINSGGDVNARKDGVNASILELSITMGRTEIIKFLLKNNVELELLNKWGCSPLMHAVLRVGRSTLFTDLEVITLLIKGGADINGKNREGSTALSKSDWILDCAASRDKVKSLLKSHGAVA